MTIDSSVSNFASIPKDYVLRVEGNVIKAEHKNLWTLIKANILDRSSYKLPNVVQVLSTVKMGTGGQYLYVDVVSKLLPKIHTYERDEHGKHTEEEKTALSKSATACIDHLRNEAPEAISNRKYAFEGKLRGYVTLILVDKTDNFMPRLFSLLEKAEPGLVEICGKEYVESVALKEYILRSAQALYSSRVNPSGQFVSTMRKRSRR